MFETTRRDFLKTTAATSVGSVFLSGSAFGQAIKEAKPAKTAKEVQAPKNPYADAILKPGPPPKPEPGSFTIVALPDTQGYSMRVPETYIAQTKWIGGEAPGECVSTVFYDACCKTHELMRRFQLNLITYHSIS